MPSNIFWFQFLFVYVWALKQLQIIWTTTDFYFQTNTVHNAYVLFWISIDYEWDAYTKHYLIQIKNFLFMNFRENSHWNEENKIFTLKALTQYRPLSHTIVIIRQLMTDGCRFEVNTYIHHIALCNYNEHRRNFASRAHTIIGEYNSIWGEYVKDGLILGWVHSMNYGIEFIFL